MTQPDRPEVDDPRLLALAQARQQIAYSSPFNFLCPPWDGLTEDEQHTSLLEARNYLHAALKAGLVSAGVAPATDQTSPSRRAGLRDDIAAVLREHGVVHFGGQVPGDEYDCCADAVLAVLYREWSWLRAEAEDAARDQTALRARLVSALDTAFRAFVSPLSDAGEGMELNDHLADAVLTVLPELAIEEQARRPLVRWHVERQDHDAWCPASTPTRERQRAVEDLEERRTGDPDREFRLVRGTTTYTVEPAAAPGPRVREA
ncbi:MULTISPECIES: hypothetical protein [unclassified Streptomyces]|uniref:hypothetical protein n=1 Tax=unclassified Streptomyces TaxID=2593676 RepID=UPI0036E9F0E4